MAPKNTYSKSRIFYGWYILAASCVILFFNSGARLTIGIMFKPMITEFDWNRSTISLAVFMNMALYALSLTVVGKFYDRYGPKWVIIISTLLLVIGYIGIFFITSIWQFLFFFGIVSALGLGGTSVPLFAALTSKWFEKGRGLAISLALSGGCLGQFALVPLFTIFVLHYGWRATYVWIALIMLCVNILLALLVIKGDPDSLGLKPFGSEHEKVKEQNENSASFPAPAHDLDLRAAMQTRSFWLFTSVMFICGSGDFLITTHLIPCVTDQGISAVTAGNMLAWFGLMSLVGILIAGPVSDLVGDKIPISITFLLRTFLFILILQYQDTTSFYIFSLFFGLTFLVTAPLTPTLIGRLYGLSHMGVLSGVITTVHHLGGGFWAYLGGLLFDRTNSYQSIFILSAIAAFIAFLCSLLIKQKR
jgi:MFS family permease